MSAAKFDQFVAEVYAALAPAGTTIEAMLSYCIVVAAMVGGVMFCSPFLSCVLYEILGGKSKAQGWMEIFYGGLQVFMEVMSFFPAPRPALVPDNAKQFLR